MKKLLSITMLLISSLFIYAQQDVTKFLGIPVDGSKSDMIQKLKAKGYTTTDLRKEKVLSQSVITYLNNDKYLNLRTIDKICQLLECNIEDIVEILPDNPSKTNEF